MLKNELIERLMNEVTVDIRIEILCQFAFINLITDMGYRENKYWTAEEDAKFKILMESAEKLSKDIMEEINNNKNKTT